MVLKSISDCLKAVTQKKFPVEIEYANVASYMLHTVNEEGHYSHISSTGNFGSIGHYIATLFTFLNPFHLTR